MRRDLASVTAFAKDAVRQEFAADQARARVQEQEALEARRREEQRAAEAEQQAQRREAERQLEEKRQRSESEQQARDAAEQAKKDQEAAVELRKQLEIERKRLDEAKKIAEDARRQREAAEQELLEVRQERKREELKGQSNAPPPASKAGTATSSPQFSENQPAPPESVPTGADSLRTRFITSDNHFGCKSRDTFDRIGTIADSGDREAFGRLLSAATIAEECIFWKKGAKVFVDDGGFATSCLRKQGETSCYWTVNEAIRRVGGGS
jgi:hypothetical protein